MDKKHGCLSNSSPEFVFFGVQSRFIQSVPGLAQVKIIIYRMRDIRACQQVKGFIGICLYNTVACHQAQNRIQIG